MTKQSAMVTAGALVLGMLAGAVGHDLSRQAPSQAPQILIQVGPPAAPSSVVPTIAPVKRGDGG